MHEDGIDLRNSPNPLANQTKDEITWSIHDRILSVVQENLEILRSIQLASGIKNPDQIKRQHEDMQNTLNEMNVLSVQGIEQ